MSGRIEKNKRFWERKPVYEQLESHWTVLAKRIRSPEYEMLEKFIEVQIPWVQERWSRDGQPGISETVRWKRIEAGSQCS
jgi:hypothetical protein